MVDDLRGVAADGDPRGCRTAARGDRGVRNCAVGGVHPQFVLSQAIASLPAAGVSVPVFLVGLAILQVFSFQLRWFPPIGNDGFASLVLPAVTLAIPVSAPIAQLLLKNIELGLNAPYVTVSVAKGASRLWVLVRDVLKNASLPALTIAGLTLGNLLAGAVIVETIYSRSGSAG